MLELAHRFILNIAGVEGFDVIFAQNFGSRRLRKVLETLWGAIECHRLNRYRADGVIRAVIRTGFVNGEQLDKAKTNFRSKIDEFL